MERDERYIEMGEGRTLLCIYSNGIILGVLAPGRGTSFSIIIPAEYIRSAIPLIIFVEGGSYFSFFFTSQACSCISECRHARRPVSSRGRHVRRPVHLFFYNASQC